MNAAVAFRLALAWLGVGPSRGLSNARRSLHGALLGIAVSLIPLLVILVVADGMISGISLRMIELSRSHISAVPDPRWKDSSGSLPEAAARIASSGVSGITDAWPEIQGTGIAVGPAGRSGGQIRAVPDNFFRAAVRDTGLLRFSSGAKAEEQGAENAFTGRTAFMGKKLAADLGLQPGDVFRLLTVRTLPGGRTVPRLTPFTLLDTVSSGYQEMDGLWIFIPFETGSGLLDANSASAFISVRTDDPFSGLQENLRTVSRLLPPGFLLYTWETLNRPQLHSFETVRTLLLFVGVMILLVAVVNISSAMVMLVLERRPEIAVLKSTGASPACIRLSFLFAGFLTGLGGLLIGLPAGIFCSIQINDLFRFLERVINIGAGFFRAFTDPAAAGLLEEEIHLLDPAFYLETIPVALDSRALFRVSSGTLLLSVLFSLLPAGKAGREKPAEILRKV